MANVGSEVCFLYLRVINIFKAITIHLTAGKKRVDEACRKKTPTKETKKDQLIEKKQSSESSLY